MGNEHRPGRIAGADPGRGRDPVRVPPRLTTNKFGQAGSVGNEKRPAGAGRKLKVPAAVADVSGAGWEATLRGRSGETPLRPHAHTRDRNPDLGRGWPGLPSRPPCSGRLPAFRSPSLYGK